jgi:hypothetical protein
VGVENPSVPRYTLARTLFSCCRSVASLEASRYT